MVDEIFASQKSFWLPSSSQGGPWQEGDAFTLSLPTSSPASIVSATVQGFNVSNNVKTPINLLSGQVTITGLGSKSVTVTFSANLQGTAFDPGAQRVYCTLGVQYPANSGVDLKKTPIAIDGGILSDATSGKNLPVYGISEYEVQAFPLSVQAYKLAAINPEYSNLVFGTKIWVQVPASAGTVVGTSTVFLLPRTNLNASINGLYPTTAWNLDTGTSVNISSVSMKGTNCIVTIAGTLASTVTLIMSFLAQDTSQLVYNAPVKGVTEIEETVLFGNYTTDVNFPMDSRVVVEMAQYDGTSVTTIVLAANNCIIKGLSGNDSNRYVWVLDQAGNLNAVTCSTVNFNGAYATITVLGDYSNSTFFFCGSILPAFDPNSSLTLVERYVPYQGDGALNRNYEVIHNDDSALVTTNGSGAAPLVGLVDVYPYNREMPIITALPSLVSWPDATLVNTPLASLFDSNYVAMRQSNVEHTFEVPLHTNDFIPPMNRDFRKEIQFITPTGGGRGYAQAIPHIGFAITAPVPRTVLGQNLQATTAPIVLYVNNITGQDSNDGLSLNSPKLTITAALDSLPPVLRDPCSIQLVYTNSPYTIATLQNSLQTIALGDGTIRSSVYYALGNLAFTIQEAGRLVITTAPGTTQPTVIDATGFAGFGNGPTSAFFVGERNSTLNLQSHATDTVSEVNITSTTVVAQAEFNSSIVVTPDFQTNGAAALTANSILARNVTVNPFLGNVSTDASSSTVTVLS